MRHPRNPVLSSAMPLQPLDDTLHASIKAKPPSMREMHSTQSPLPGRRWSAWLSPGRVLIAMVALIPRSGLWGFDAGADAVPRPIDPATELRFELAEGRICRVLREGDILSGLTVLAGDGSLVQTFAFPRAIFRIDRSALDAHGFWLTGPFSSVNDAAVFLDPKGESPPQSLSGRRFTASPDGRYVAYLPVQLRHPGQAHPSHLGVRVYDRSRRRPCPPPTPIREPDGVQFLRSPLVWNSPQHLRWIAFSDGRLCWCGLDARDRNRWHARVPEPMPVELFLRTGVQPGATEGESPLWRCHVERILPPAQTPGMFEIGLVPADGLTADPVYWTEVARQNVE